MTALNSSLKFLGTILLLFFAATAFGQDESHFVDSIKTQMADDLESGRVDHALQLNSLLIRHYADVGDDYEYVRQNVNRAEVLRGIGGQEEALKTLLAVEELNNSLKLSTVRSTFYNRKAAILYELKDTDGALEALDETQRIDSIKGYRWRFYSNLNLKGAIYRDKKNYKKAQLILEKAYRMAASEKDSAEWASAAYNLTHLCRRQLDFKGAIRYGRVFTDVQRVKHNNITYGDILHILGHSYAEVGNFDSAYFFSDSAFGVRMVHMQTIIDDNVNKYEVVDELEKERLQTSILKAEKERTNLQFLILILAISVAVLLVFFANKQRIQYKKLSEKEKAYNIELESSLAFKNKLISIVAHDIRNPMSSLKGLIHVYNEGLVEEKDLRTMMGGLEASVSNVDLLLENLLNWVRTQNNSLNPHFEEVQITNLVENALIEAEPQIKAKSIEVLRKNISSEDALKVDANFMAFILRNILSNAIKYSNEGGKIEISFEKDERGECIAVQDFGKGMNPDTLQKLHDNQSINSSLGTGKEKGTGLGIALSREFLSKLGGYLAVESALGEGTKVRICLYKDRKEA